MKHIFFSFLSLAFLLFLFSPLEGQTIWNGAPMTFTKPDSADWTMAEYQDRITEDVWITRADKQPIFNIASESPENWAPSPKDTRWAMGSIGDGVETLNFKSWVDAIDGNPPGMLDQNMVVYLVSDDIYVDIKFTSWTSGEAAGGGGFSYDRSTGIPSEQLWTGEVITFTKENFSDWTLADNQDRITDKVWITRADNQGIFNIAVENGYESGSFGTIIGGSPIQTEWAFGTISEGVQNLDFDLWGFTIDWEPPLMVGKNMVMHSIPDDIYIDIKFTSWSVGDDGGGGGFSYERSTGSPSDQLWTGDAITFSKGDSVDWTSPENQDRITENVWITRAHKRGIFNIAKEKSFESVYVESPTMTEWAFGNTDDGVENLDFNYFLNTVDFAPPSMLNKDMVLRLIPDDIYIDIKFTSWTSGDGNGGGGFSYIRSTENPTSTHDISSKEGKLVIYPSPASTSLYIKDADPSSPVFVELYNLTGIKVISTTIGSEEVIHVDHLPGGLYIYRLFNADHSQSGRIIIE